MKFGAFDYAAPSFAGALEGTIAEEREVGLDGGYEANVAAGVAAIRAGRYRKIVLARARDLRATTRFHPLRALNALRGRFPDCYAFSAGNGAGSSFIGASPERLVSAAGGTLRTEALAGSAPRGRTAAEDAALARVLEGPLATAPGLVPVLAPDLRARVAAARARGWAETANTFEADVSSFAVPLLDAQGQVQGALAVAAAAPRLTDAARVTIPLQLIAAAREIMALWGGHPPAELSALWRKTEQPTEKVQG